MTSNHRQKKKDRDDAVRRLVRQVIATRFDGNLSHAAKAIGLRQSTLHGFASPDCHRGAGPIILNALSEYLGMTHDELFRGELIERDARGPTIEDELDETVAFAVKWLGVTQPAVDRVLAMCRGSPPMRARQLIDQLRAAQDAIDYTSTLNGTSTRMSA